MTYTFGDTDLAAERLRILAEVFEEPSRAFLESIPVREPKLAVDLGCGPGYTTRLLANVLQCEQTVGLDNSEHFLSVARRTGDEKLSFLRHDVTSIPFPVAPADVVYSRLLLTHMSKPEELIQKWATQLRPGGVVALEEPERIGTENQALKRYLEIVAEMMAREGNNLYVGSVLDGIENTKEMRRRKSEIRRYRVSNRDAAAMFSRNIQTWKDREYIKETYSAAEIEELQQELVQMREGQGELSEIEWEIRQMVFERV